MSYFDHVQCHACGAKMQPEQLAPGRGGEAPACPYCNATLNLKDLFGVKDSFVGLHDEEGNDHTLDDLLTNDLYDGRYADGRAPQAAPPAARRAQKPQGGGAQPSKSTPSLRALTGPSGGAGAGSGAMVPTNRRRDAWEDDDSGGTGNQGGNAPSAADLLRSMKKKR